MAQLAIQGYMPAPIDVIPIYPHALIEITCAQRRLYLEALRQYNEMVENNTTQQQPRQPQTTNSTNGTNRKRKFDDITQ